MIKIKLENRFKKTRTENWSEDEKRLLENLVKERYHIVENKNTDTTTNVLKSEAWKQIWERFVLENRRPRSVQRLRDQWKRMKSRKHSKKTEKDNSQNDGNHFENLTEQQGDDLLLQDNNTSTELSSRDFKCTEDNFIPDSPPKTKKIITQMYESKRGGLEYKRSLLELNKIVKEQLTNCALEEHGLRMQQLKEEHQTKMQMTNELHSLECENKRLQAKLFKLEIEIKKKQLDNFDI